MLHVRVASDTQKFIFLIGLNEVVHVIPPFVGPNIISDGQTKVLGIHQ